METLRSDTGHTSDSLRSTLSHMNAHIDKLTKEKEDELLYGGDEDGDEEEALSDDSMRLRLSDDDEPEPEDIPTPIPADVRESQPEHEKNESAAAVTVDAQSSPPSENVVTENKLAGRKGKQEEHSSGNVSMDEKVVNGHRRGNKMNGNGLLRLPMPVHMHYPWQNFEPQWRFPSSPRVRLYHCANRPSYPRYHFPTPSEHYRNESIYYNRFLNAYPQFIRRRGNITYNSYHKDFYSNRKEKHHVTKLFNNANDKKKTSTPSDIKSCTEDKSYSSTDNKEIVDTVINEQDEQNEKVDGTNSTGSKMSETSVIETSAKIMSTTVASDQQTKDSDINTETNSLGMTNETMQVADSIQNVESLAASDIKTEDLASIETSSICDSFNQASVNSVISDENEMDGSTKQEALVQAEDSDICDISTSNHAKEDGIAETENDKHECNENKIDSINTNHEKHDESSTAMDTSDIAVIEKLTEVSCFEKQNKNGQIDTTEECKKVDANNIVLEQSEVVSENVTSSECNFSAVTDNLEASERADEVLQTEEEETIEIKDEKCITVNNVISSLDESTEKILQTDIKSENHVIKDSSTDTMKCEKPTLNKSDDSTTSEKENKLTVSENGVLASETNLQSHVSETVKCLKTESKKMTVINCINKQSEKTEASEVKPEQNNSSDLISKTKDIVQEDNANANAVCTDKNSSTPIAASLNLVTDVTDSNCDSAQKDIEVPVTNQRRRRRSKQIVTAAREAASEEEKQVKEARRHKRRTARTAEEIIKKRFISNSYSDVETSDDSEKVVNENHRMNQDVRPSSPVSLKRNCPETDFSNLNGAIKKVKTNLETPPNDISKKEKNGANIKDLSYVHKFFQRDLKGKLPKMKQEELEELLIQKIVETITMRGEIGRLREQARISERNQEATRARCQLLSKQIKDFEMVLNRNAADRRANNDRPTPPIKINRSVGLQVNFMTDNGMHNLRQLQAINMKSTNVQNGSNSTSSETTHNNNTPRRGIKVRSPRRSDTSSGGQSTVVSQTHTQTSPLLSTITPAALVVAKTVDSSHTLTLSNQANNVQQMLTNPQSQQQQPQKIILNGKLTNQITRQNATINVSKTRANDLIDLTDEEEKSKAIAVNMPIVTTAIAEQPINIAPKGQPCFQRVIQAIPGSMAITSQPTSIRVVQPASQPTPTALVNNMNAPRLAYVMQSAVGSTRQLLITSNASQIRPVTSCARPTFSTVTYKTGTSTVANGTVRVLTTQAGSAVQINKHPAPLPDTPNYTINPMYKLPPPAPSLKISKVANGIVLSWNMTLSDKYADIASYQLYAYQEVNGVAPSTSLWKKVGDVRALPLPMACTLTQFSEGNNYYFAVRAVDTHSRKGQYSVPGNISL